MNSKDMQKILLIGDSISVGYAPHVRETLVGKLQVVHNEGNADDSRNILANLDAYLAANKDAGVIHLNCGLHDIKRLDGQNSQQVPLDEYGRNIRQIIKKLIDQGKQVIWALTTPVADTIHNCVKDFRRFESDVLAYNAVAADIASEEGLLVNDLHSAVIAAGIAQCLDEDGVHMTEEGYRACGEAVAKAISQNQTN